MSTIHQGTALLIMDIQQPMIETYKDAPALLENLQQLIAAARKSDIPVIYVRLAFRPGYPEINPANETFGMISKSGAFVEGTPTADFHPSIAPQPGDIVVSKKRFSAFAGSGLDIILRSKGIKQLVLTGLSTSGIVLSTVREAFDKDYNMVVIADACGDRDTDIHEFLVNRIFPKQAKVTSTKDWILSL
ncbi:cysteine hydrolase [Chitinophaga silvatica]|uniref:Cysteine hydrolase n=1 Tax=Chitinophaga silvatica TaxID=2282649 RepID=A0A3E1Y9D9_9BACT|nr:cysteine hydrolase [Chitinophaga silvatica]RFS21816.1 cysteine hydrolase [Chitinophaga silvatica]